MFDLMPKLLRSPIFFCILFLIILMFPSAIYKTGESERLAISVAVGLNLHTDKPKEEQLELSLMYLTPQSNGNLEKNYAVTTVNGQNVSDCLSTTSARIGKEIGLSHCQVIILSESLAKNGPLEYLDSFTRTNDLTTNSLLICSQDPKKLIEAQISESAKVSLSLNNVLDYITDHEFTGQANLEKFYADYFDESSTCFLPFIDAIDNKGATNSQASGSSNTASQGGTTGGGGQDANEGSSNSNSGNDQSASSGSSQQQKNNSSDSSNSEATTVGSQGPADQEIEFDDTFGLFKHGKLVAKLDKENSQIFNILYSKKGKSTIHLNGFYSQYAQLADITINVEDKQGNISYNFVNGYPVVGIDLSLYCKVSEVNTDQYTLDTVSVVNEQLTDRLREEIHKDIEQQLAKAINFAKSNNVDMFHVAKNFHRLSTQEWAKYKLELDADNNYMRDIIFTLNLKLIEFA